MNTQLRSQRPLYIRDVDVAQMLSISRMTVWRWAKLGVIPAPLKIGPGTTRWRRADIEAGIEHIENDEHNPV